MTRAAHFFTLSYIIAALVVGCGIPSSPALRGFGNNEAFILVEDMKYTIGSTKDTIVVPKGFVTNNASIPKAFWSLGLTPHGQYSRASIIHDYLYWSQACTRKQADQLMVIMMKESNVGWFDETVIYNGVHAGGEGAWKKNTRNREAGMPGIIPAEYIPQRAPNVLWKKYRAELIMKGIRAQKFDPNPSYCKYGDSSEVPE